MPTLTTLGIRSRKRSKDTRRSIIDEDTYRRLRNSLCTEFENPDWRNKKSRKTKMVPEKEPICKRSWQESTPDHRTTAKVTEPKLHNAPFEGSTFLPKKPQSITKEWTESSKAYEREDNDVEGNEIQIYKPANLAVISVAGLCDSNDANYFPLQEEISYLESKLRDLGFMYNRLEDQYETLKRSHNYLEMTVKNADIIARDQIVFDNLRLNYDIVVGELSEARILIKELQALGWDKLPQKLVEECKSASEKVEMMRKLRDQALHRESTAKGIANETLKKVNLLEGIIESQKLALNELKCSLDNIQLEHEKQLFKLNDEWERKLFRRHARDKRRHAHLLHQLKSFKEVLSDPTAEKLTKILFDASLAFQYPCMQSYAKLRKPTPEDQQNPCSPKPTKFIRGMWEIIGMVNPEVADKLLRCANVEENSLPQFADASSLTHPYDCSRVIAGLTHELYYTKQLCNQGTERSQSARDVTETNDETTVAIGTSYDALAWEQTKLQLEKKLEEKDRENKVLKKQVKKLQTDIEASRANAFTEEDLSLKLKNLQEENRVLADHYETEVVLRKKYHNMVEDIKGKIRVYCRVRPACVEDLEKSGDLVVSVPDTYTIVVRGQKSVKYFQFDRIFDMNSTQMEVFEDTSNLVQSAIDGYNVCIFAYGQTGSGKTLTLLGNRDNPGLAPRVFNHLFELLREPGFASKYSSNVSVTMLELYNDKLLDLLLENAEHTEKMEIRKDNNGTVYVPGAVKRASENAKQMHEIYEFGLRNRHTASTKINSQSSRSHLILSILVTTTDRVTGSTFHGKFSIIDLAGSERIVKSGATGEVAKEAQAINVSLSALGDVISALTMSQSFIPYRNSKLTMLMQDSLGGNAKTLMFVAVSPLERNVSETISSLNYAARVKLVTNDASKNSNSDQVAKLKATIERLKRGEPE